MITTVLHGTWERCSSLVVYCTFAHEWNRCTVLERTGMYMHGNGNIVRLMAMEPVARVLW